ncbi:condensation domain-containing protein [Streptomyces sp. NPDC048192]|uniref:condensation domain-containing protein n=1 Tax=Streptomyces sp. NPDC048192 TaxID=3365510 RepID=UPI00371211E8
MPLQETTAPPDTMPSPLTDAQLGLWLAHQIRPGDADLHVVRAFRVSGPLDRTALHRALEDVTTAHPALRSLHPADGSGSPVRSVQPPPGAPDWSDLGSGSDRELADFHRRPFDLETEPPVRAGISRPDPDGRTLVAFCFHHIAMDAVSAAVFCRDLAEAYVARTSGGPPGTATRPSGRPRPSHATGRRSVTGRADAEAAAAYWAHRMSAPPAPLVHAPAARVPATGRPARTGELRRGAPAVRALRQTARSAGATVHMVLTAAYAAALADVFQRDEVVVGCPVSLRGAGDADVVDCLVTMLPLRVRPEDGFGVALLGQVRERSIEAQRHRTVPAAVLAGAAGAATLETPYQAVLDIRQEAVARLPLRGCRSEAVDTEAGSVQYPLDLEARIGRDAVRLVLRTDAAAVAPRQADAVLTALDALLWPAPPPRDGRPEGGAP